MIQCRCALATLCVPHLSRARLPGACVAVHGESACVYVRQELLRTSKRGRGDVGAAMDKEEERLAQEAGEGPARPSFGVAWYPWQALLWGRSI